MNSHPYPRLLWKEYRAIRLFWLSLAGLVIFLQWLTLVVVHTNPVVPLFNLAFIAPAFFALGCAGTAFAIEKEDGTFDFLQASPVRSSQLLITKLLLAVTATACMYLVLTLTTLVFTRGATPDSSTIAALLGLWAVAAVELIAWGTLFSLLTARPLLAICLAAAVGLVVTSYLASGVHAFRNFNAEEPYLDAIPSRAIVALIVLGTDVWLGLRWLSGGILRKSKPAAAATCNQLSPAVSTDRAYVSRLLNEQDRPVVMARLLWQQWRQSWWQMLLIALISIIVTLWWHFAVLIGKPTGPSAVELPMLVSAALMGSFVFRGDQESSRFRFFAAHNVPPHCVWLSRQIPWLITLFVSTLILYFVRIGPTIAVAWFGMTHWDWLRTNTIGDPFGLSKLPNISFGIACVAVSYAAGQWASMFVRSGLLAGSIGVVLGGTLCAWAALMDMMHISWTWSVIPIPILLCGTTWLRAPDWIRENTSWRARTKAALIVLIPLFALLIAVPVYRVYQVPLIAPGFDPAEFAAAISSEALETGEIYHRMADRVVDEPHMNWRDNPTSIYPPVNSRTNLPPGEAKWMRANADLMPEILAASQRESCAFENCAIQDYQSPRPVSLIWLLVCSAREFDREGKLDEALDRYLSALRVVSQFAQFSLPSNCENMADQAHGIIGELCYWAALKGQTPERIHGALEKLQTIDAGMLHFDDAFKVQDILERRVIADSLHPWPGPRRPMFADLLWNNLMPWERYRNLRQLNWSTIASLRNLEHIQTELRSGHVLTSGSLELFQSSWHDQRFNNPFDAWLALNADTSSAAASKLAEFEANKRATTIILALEEYRLDKGALPNSLSDLAGHYLETVPVDPYSGKPFVYFPWGIAKPSNDLERFQLMQGRGHNHPYLRPIVEVEVPCIWSTGPDLIAAEARYTPRTQSDLPDREVVATYYEDRGSFVREALPAYTAWARGEWFRIPEKK